VYRAVIRLGAFSETDDAEGPLHPFEPPPTPPSSEALERCVRTFVGEIEQRPPNYSAVKIGGQRLYDLARRGEAVEAPLRTVHVHEIDLEDYSFPEVTLRVSCAGGTYVRSIARDLGEILETGGYLAELSRIESGGFSLREGADLENLQRSDVLPLEQALQQMPRVDIAAMQAKRLANGAVIRADLPPLSLDPDEPLFGWVHGRAVALLKREGPGQVRAGRLLITVDDLKDLAEQELAAQDAADL
jgi:tRNA pseudouridine55 synthase